MHVLRHTSKREVQGELATHRIVGADAGKGTGYTDEHLAYWRLDKLGISYATVRHGSRQLARDEDGDGVREVHNKTIERFWTGVRWPATCCPGRE